MYIKYRKVFVLLICMMFTAVLFIGCGGGGNSTPEPHNPVDGQSVEELDEPAVTSSEPVDSEETSAPSILDVFAKANDIDGLYFESVITTPGSGKIESKTWTQGDKIRNEVDIDGQTVISIIDADKGESYTYMPVENIAMKFVFDDSVLESFQRPTDYTNNIDPAQYRIVETVSYQGYKCTVVIYTDGQEETIMWVSEAHGIPLRIESKSNGVTTLIEYKNIQIGSIPDDVFTLPAGAEVRSVDLGSFMDFESIFNE